MITLYKNQKPIKMSKSKDLFIEQREAERQREWQQYQTSAEIFQSIEKSIKKIADNYRNILIATDSICKERKATNDN